MCPPNFCFNMCFLLFCLDVCFFSDCCPQQVPILPPRPTNPSKPAQNGAQMGPKIDPKTMQNRSQFLKAKKNTLEDALGAVLGRSWPDLGALRARKSCSRSSRGCFFKIYIFHKKVASRSVLGRTCSDFGAQRGPNGRPSRALEAPKTSPT